MSRYIKVAGHENLYRDEQSGAIINKESPKEKHTFQENFRQVKSDVDNIKYELNEIKNLLKVLIDNK